MLGPIYGLFIVIARVFIKKQVNEGDIKSAKDGLEFLREVLSLCLQKGKQSVFKLSWLVTIHKGRCFKQSCECRKIFTKGYFDKASSEILSLNFDAYDTNDVLPNHIKDSWKLKAFKILLYELIPLYNTSSYALHLAISEISFYYFANYFQALLHAESATDPSFVCSQRILNLRKTVEKALASSKAGKTSTLQAIKFQTKYSEFLEGIDDSCESTAKFWLALSETPPDPFKMIENGKDLNNSKEKILTIAQEIISITNNHTEFLVKLGVYLKWIAHDKPGATKIFQKIQLACDDSSAMLFNRDDKFSVLRSENHVGMVTVSLESKDFFLITKINYEVELCLGYKKEELLNASMYRLMPAMISAQHQGFVKRFMETMNSKCINKQSFGYIKRQNGYISPCRMFKRILPCLSKGLQGILFFYEDSIVSFYTSSKTDPTKRKVNLCWLKLKLRAIS